MLGHFKQYNLYQNDEFNYSGHQGSKEHVYITTKKNTKTYAIEYNDDFMRGFNSLKEY